MGAELRALFDVYADAFNRFDVDAIAGFFRVPCLMVNADFVAPSLTDHALHAKMPALLTHHREQGSGRAQVTGLRCDAQGENLALAHVDWKVEVPGGPTDLIFRNSYNLARHDTDWKILVSTTHSA